MSTPTRSTQDHIADFHRPAWKFWVSRDSALREICKSASAGDDRAVDALGRIIAEYPSHPSYRETAARTLGKLTPEEKRLPAVSHLAAFLEQYLQREERIDDTQTTKRFVAAIEVGRVNDCATADIDATRVADSLGAIGQVARQAVPVLFRLVGHLNKKQALIAYNCKNVFYEASCKPHTSEEGARLMLFENLAPQFAAKYQMRAEGVLKSVCKILNKNWAKEGSSLLSWWQSEGKSLEYK